MMKTKFRFLQTSTIAKIATVILVLPLLQGCDDEEAIENMPGRGDFMGCDIVIHVENEDGENLLLPETPGYIDPKDVIVMYKRKKYEFHYKYMKDGKPYPFDRNLGDDDPWYETSDYPGIWKEKKTRVHDWQGLYDGYTMNWEPTINFGEFSPTRDYHNEEFEVIWPDGSSDKIAFDLYIDRSNGEEVYTKRLYLNGKPVDTIIIVK